MGLITSYLLGWSVSIHTCVERKRNQLLLRVKLRHSMTGRSVHKTPRQKLVSPFCLAATEQKIKQHNMIHKKKEHIMS